MAARAKIQLKPRINLEEPAAPSSPELAPRVAKDPGARIDRQGKKLIAGHFPKATWVTLRQLCLEHDRTSQQMLEEALTDLFAKYRRS